MRKTTTAMALALLWAPTNQAFHVQNSARTTCSAALSTPTVLAAVAPNSNDINDNNVDWEALDRKNASRKKFGLKPMTPEEFVENETLVQQMAVEQQQRVAAAAATKSNDRTRQQQQQTPSVSGFLEKIFSDVVPDTCESNFDCEAPKVCCDFGVSKVCCAGGQRQRSREGELALVPIPIDVFPEGPSNYY